MAMTFFVWGFQIRACVSPPHPRVSHMVEVAASMAQAASTALPPFWNIMAPAVAARASVSPPMPPGRPANTGRS